MHREKEPQRFDPAQESSSPPRVELELVPPQPTTLHLFDLPEGQLDRLRARQQDTEPFRSKLFSARNAFREVSSRLTRSMNSLEDFTSELEDEIDLLGSQHTINSTYCVVTEHLIAKGVPLDDANTYFRKVLTAYLLYLAPDQSEAHQIMLTKLSKKPTGKNGWSAEHPPIKDLFLARHAGKKPDWFGGTDQEWSMQVVNDATFLDVSGREGYQELEIADENKTEVGIMSIPNTPAFKKGVPDWLKKPVLDQTPDNVREILYRQTRGEISLFHQHERTMDQLQKLAVMRNEKALEWLRQNVQYTNERFNNQQSLGDLLLDLDAVDGVDISSWGLNEDGFVFRNNQENSTQATASETMIMNFFKNNQTFISREAVGLWFEKILQKAKVMKSAQEKVTPEVAEVLRRSLNDEDYVDASARLPSSIRHQLLPILSLLQSEERSYLTEWIGAVEGNGGTVEDVIWETAETITSQFDRLTGDVADEKTTGIIVEMGVNYYKWVLKNHDYALEQLQDKLAELPQVEEGTSGEQVLSVQEEGVQDEVIDIQELTEVAEQAEKGNLDSWTLKYASKQKTASNHLDVIGGATLEERSQALADYLGQEHVSCNVKPSSVINALDYLASLPAGELQKMPRIESKGEEFFKIYRGDVRILCKINSDDHEIDFFIYQKKADEYRL